MILAKRSHQEGLKEKNKMDDMKFLNSCKWAKGEWQQDVCRVKHWNVHAYYNKSKKKKKVKDLAGQKGMLIEFWQARNETNNI